MTDDFGNAGSLTHRFGEAASKAVAEARATIANAIGAADSEIIFTSGATESNNLALRGVASHSANRGKHIIAVVTEHKSVLDPLARIVRDGFDATYVPVIPHGQPDAGRVDPGQIADAFRPDTFLVTVMLANNEIGVIQPMAEIGALCKERGILFHSDATQAVGRIPVDVDRLQLDLMSFSAHKLYGPKGVGALFVRNRGRRIRIRPMVLGGGHEKGLRSGTLNVPGVCGFAKAIEICSDKLDMERVRVTELRDALFHQMRQAVPGVGLNGPSLDRPDWRLPGNLNLCFEQVDGQALMMANRQLALSSGSACTAANPEPSHVLRALGLSDDHVRSSLRFGLGRFNTAKEVARAVELLAESVRRLRNALQ